MDRSQLTPARGGVTVESGHGMSERQPRVGRRGERRAARALVGLVWMHLAAACGGVSSSANDQSVSDMAVADAAVIDAKVDDLAADDLRVDDLRVDDLRVD